MRFFDHASDGCAVLGMDGVDKLFRSLIRLDGFGPRAFFQSTSKRQTHFFVGDKYLRCCRIISQITDMCEQRETMILILRYRKLFIISRYIDIDAPATYHMHDVVIYTIEVVIDII